MSNKKYWIFFVTMFLVYLVLRLDVVSASDDKFTRPSLKGIKGLNVLIEALPKALENSGLNEDMIRTDVELKLRLAGITVVSDYGVPYLYVNINAITTPVRLIAFNISVGLYQGVYLKRDTSMFVFEAKSMNASTWSDSLIGTAGELDIHYIREKIKDKVDVFINAYLSVNPKGGK